jgi:hypothetical protein
MELSGALRLARLSSFITYWVRNAQLMALSGALRLARLHFFYDMKTSSSFIPDPRYKLPQPFNGLNIEQDNDSLYKHKSE